ncbi:DUF222 domain-containing protein [Arthrobacter sp. NPDC097144]|uniref:HNH endonuclease signature motif containing protein n=1 Tax=Arthrobacter sp. NPDC097144 TaxID=3363946 RepID=UPI00382D12F5
MQRFEFNAVPGESGPGTPESPGGLTGTLQVQNVHRLSRDELLVTLERLDALLGWAQAQQARGVARLEALVVQEMAPDKDCDSQTVSRLAASEVGALLSLPPLAAQRLVGESTLLCDTCPATLAAVEAGKLSYRKAQVICSTVASLRDPDRTRLEARLLEEAGGRTASQLDRLARRLYEGLVPDAELTLRHRRAREGRRVWLEPDRDGMCFLSACLSAAEGQAIFNGLTACARAEQSAGDARGTDQLRTDILTSLLLGTADIPQQAGITGHPSSAAESSSPESGTHPEPSAAKSAAKQAKQAKQTKQRITPEVMVLINAETILGLDDRPAELHGYGPISAESARELLRHMGRWTGLLQDAQSGEILSVGRQRRIPTGLRRWLQARDSTCRFPGCVANALTAEIDHTIPWARGGPTSHDNLECLCRKHHWFKTNGFWKAHQPEPGVLEWISPAGRTYRTQAYFPSSRLLPGRPVPDQESCPEPDSDACESEPTAPPF